jgi:hypothetical protein
LIHDVDDARRERERERGEETGLKCFLFKNILK